MANNVTMKTDGDIAKAVNQVLLAYGLQVDEEMDKVIEKTCKEAVKELKKNSEAHGWRKYAKTWTFQKQKGKNNGKGTIYNSKHGALTHLLENGHVKVLWGRSTGERVAGIPHIAPVNDRIAQELPKEIENALSK